MVRSLERNRAHMAEWRKAHPGYYRPYYEANKERYRANDKAWWEANPERHAYNLQKSNAKRRGVPFLLTLEEWCAIWQASGKWRQRGIRKGQFGMARFGDQGPYTVGNVRICATEENRAERITLEETRRLLSEANKRRWAKQKQR